MGKIMTALKRVPKRTAALAAIVAAAIVLPGALLAWGPDRATFTEQNPAPYVTFDSITNNSVYGDERNFVTIKDAANTSDGGWTDKVTAQPGHEYTVRMFVHNNAAANLNLVATNTRASVSVGANTGKSVPISGFITSDNANPQKIWDDVELTSDQDFNLNYVPGSADFHNNGIGSSPSGVDLPDSIFTSTGALLGYDKLDGKIPGCYQFAGYVFFKVKPQFGPKSNFEVSKQVSKPGDSAWHESVDTKAGDTVNYLLSYKNTGGTAHDNVLIQDTLPAGLTYVNGSSKLTNDTNSGTAINDDVVKPVGVNVGNYAPGATAYITFKAKVNANDQLPVCGPNKLTNKVRMTANGYYKEDTADVTTTKECQPEVKYTCDGLTVTKIERTKFKFDTKYTVQNATLKSIVYVIRDDKGNEVARQTNPEYTQSKVGKYTVEAIVTVTVNGQDKVAAGDCKQPFEVVKENTPAVSITKKVDGVKTKTVGVDQEFTYQIVVANTGEVDLKNAMVSDKAPTGVTFLKASAGSISGDAWSYTIASLKVGESTSFTITAKVPTFLAGKIVNTACVDAQEVPGSPDMCDTATVEVPPTPTTPETPTELPHTGASDSIVALIGVGSLIAAIGYYIASRRAANA